MRSIVHMPRVVAATPSELTVMKCDWPGGVLNYLLLTLDFMHGLGFQSGKRFGPRESKLGQSELSQATYSPEAHCIKAMAPKKPKCAQNRSTFKTCYPTTEYYRNLCMDGLPASTTYADECHASSLFTGSKTISRNYLALLLVSAPSAVVRVEGQKWPPLRLLG